MHGKQAFYKKILRGKQSFYKVFFLDKQSLYKVFSNDSYDQLKFHIFAWLGLNPDYAPVEHSVTQKNQCYHSRTPRARFL